MQVDVASGWHRPQFFKIIEEMGRSGAEQHRDTMPCSLFDNSFYYHHYQVIVGRCVNLSGGIELPQHRTIVGFFCFFLYLTQPVWFFRLCCDASVNWPPESDSLFLHISGSIAHSKWLSVFSNVVQTIDEVILVKSVSETFILSFVSILFTLSELCLYLIPENVKHTTTVVSKSSHWFLNSFLYSQKTVPLFIKELYLENCILKS